MSWEIIVLEIDVRPGNLKRVNFQNIPHLMFVNTVHCFDASCMEICYFFTNKLLKLQEFQATGIKYRVLMMQYFVIVLMPVAWKSVILKSKCVKIIRFCKCFDASCFVIKDVMKLQ